MIDVSEIITDPDFCQDFIVLRSTGSFVNHRWVENANTEVPMTGIIQVANEKELDQVLEGDRIKGAMVFYSTEEFLLSHGGNTQGISDIAVYKGEKYKLYQTSDWGDFGYYKAIGTRILGY